MVNYELGSLLIKVGLACFFEAKLESRSEVELGSGNILIFCFLFVDCFWCWKDH